MVTRRKKELNSRINVLILVHVHNKGKTVISVAGLPCNFMPRFILSENIIRGSVCIYDMYVGNFKKKKDSFQWCNFIVVVNEIETFSGIYSVRKFVFTFLEQFQLKLGHLFYNILDGKCRMPFVIIYVILGGNKRVEMLICLQLQNIT